MSTVTSWTFQQKIEESFKRTLPRLGPEARNALAEVITPQSLMIIAGIMLAWIISHGFGVGEAIDLILAVVGVFAIGFAVFSGLDHLYHFASGTYNASSEQDLNDASEHLAKAIAILGITAVLAVLFRGRPATGRGGKINVGPPPPKTPGIRFKPTITRTGSRSAGTGATSFWGDVTVSTLGSVSDQKIVLLHELVHQFLAPKLYLLRNIRVANRAGSYFRSSLWRYLEEALAETVAQVGVNGLKSFFVGLRFPVNNGYVFLTRGGGFNVHMKGGGIVPESAALIASGFMNGIAINLWFSSK